MVVNLETIRRTIIWEMIDRSQLCEVRARTEEGVFMLKLSVTVILLTITVSK